MIWPRWLAKWIAVTFGYFWLPCPNCGQKFAGFEMGKYCMGTDCYGRRYRHTLADMLPVLMASEDERRYDVPRQWWRCCKHCDMWLPVLWRPAGFDPYSEP